MFALPSTQYGANFSLPYTQRSFLKHAPVSTVIKTPVSIYKTENTYEVLVFAPGRLKENFSINVSGEELMITYHPTEDKSSFNWIRREYNHGGFERTFFLDHILDGENICMRYENGVLNLSLNIIREIE